VTFFVHSWSMTVRLLRSLARQPWYVAITLVQPVVWLFLFGGLFRRVVDIPGFSAGSYVDFLAPGIVIMSALFSAGWSGMGVINDLDRGVMDRFLVSPVRRSALVVGRIAHQSVVTTVQTIIISTLAVIAGARFDGGLLGVLVMIASAILLAAGVASLSNALAMILRREESVIAAVQFVAQPATFLSSAFMERALMPGWMQRAAAGNPVHWAAEASRSALAAAPDWPMIATRLASLFGFALVCGWLSLRAFRAYQRSV
jgi:ABC-2 type transport system permease protein